MEAEARAEAAGLDTRVRFSRNVNESQNTVEVSFQQILDKSHQYYDNIVKQPLVYLSTLQRYIEETITSHPQLTLAGDPIGARIVTPRQLSAGQMCQVFKVVGIVTKSTPPLPSLRDLVVYNTDTHAHTTQKFEDPFTTLGQQRFNAYIPRSDEKGAQRQFALSKFVSQQRLQLQDCPEHVPQGRIPCSIQIVLTSALVDRAKAGDRVEIVGVLLPAPNVGPKEAKSQQVRVFLLGYSVQVVQKSRILHQPVANNEFEMFLSTLQSLKLLNRSPSCPALEIIAASLAPSIYGHQLVKKAIALQLLGGISRHRSGTRIRGDINILLIGSPGCGKSQLLRAAQNLAQISVSASGRGASGAGLTAAVVIDKHNGNRSLEAGAFVLADGGLLTIDEFDKLQQYDRVAIHEAMEQQTVSISKAGIQATLNARCSVLAAANFIYGGFDEEKTIAENINLPDSLLSRFDLVFIIRDSLDYDREIAKHVVQNHIQSEPYQQSSQIISSIAPQQTQQIKQHQQETQNALFGQMDIHDFLVYNDAQHKHLLQQFQRLVGSGIPVSKARFLLSNSFLRNLLIFCQQQASSKPEMTPEAIEAVSDAYARLRKEESRGLLVSARSLEAIIRLATALAKMSYPLRDVIKEDVEEAYVLVRHSLFQESESEIRRTLDKKQTVADEKASERRYDLFLDGFRAISENAASDSLYFSDIVVELRIWLDENHPGEEEFEEKEVRRLAQRMASAIDEMQVDKDAVYF